MAKGTKLKVPTGARPASERVRQAVFSSLGERIEGARVLDLYCGSGAYGLEALSRGADHATFVDESERAIEICRANAAAAGFTKQSRARRAPADRYLGRQARADGPFDLVFADPPYAAGDLEALIELLGPVLDDEGVAVAETRASHVPLRTPAGFVQQADRRYGDTRILMFSLGER